VVETEAAVVLVLIPELVPRPRAVVPLLLRLPHLQMSDRPKCHQMQTRVCQQPLQ